MIQLVINWREGRIEIGVAIDDMIATSSGIIFSMPIAAINEIAMASHVIFSIPLQPSMT